MTATLLIIMFIVGVVLFFGTALVPVQRWLRYQGLVSTIATIGGIMGGSAIGTAIALTVMFGGF